MSHSGRGHRYYESSRSNYGTHVRSQMSNPDENYEEMSEDLQKIFDDDSKCARLLKKIFREERSSDIRIQRIQEFEIYLEKSDSNKVINQMNKNFCKISFLS